MAAHLVNRMQMAMRMELRRRGRDAAAMATSAALAPVKQEDTKNAAKRRRTSRDDDAKAGSTMDGDVARSASRRRMSTARSKEAIKEHEDGDDASGKVARKLPLKRDRHGRPEQWEKVLEGIQTFRETHKAEVDVHGCETFYDPNKYSPPVARFHVLIAALMSSQTKDPVNAAAMQRLLEHGLTVDKMLAIEEKQLALLIRPVGFFNNKAKFIKQVAQILKNTAVEAGAPIDIPNTFEALIKLPGIGPKMAHLVMSVAWKTTVGICVDTHVHRISNRLGWVKTWNIKNPKSQDPEKTRKELEDWLPQQYWNPINVLLVGFGQTMCLPRDPKCADCPVRQLCPSAHSSKI